jgi:hypothetical protein
MLSQTLADVRKRIAKTPKGLNENNTKATLIEPVLRALGCDVEDVEEVAREHKGKKQDKFPTRESVKHRTEVSAPGMSGHGRKQNSCQW